MYLVPRDIRHLTFCITTHSVPVLRMTPPLHLLSIMPADQILNPFNICGCHFSSYPVQPFYPTHRTSISQLSCVPALPFLLSDLPPYPSTCALFHFSQWPVQRMRKRKCLWWESMWNKWGGNFSLALRGPRDWWQIILSLQTNELQRGALTLDFAFKKLQPLINAWQHCVMFLTLNCIINRGPHDWQKSKQKE